MWEEERDEVWEEGRDEVWEEERDEVWEEEREEVTVHVCVCVCVCLSQEVELHACPECGKEYTTRPGLQYHIRVHHTQPKVSQ